MTRKEVIVVVGPSGSGKRTAIGVLEDLFDYGAVTKLRPAQMVELADIVPGGNLVFDLPFTPSRDGDLNQESLAFVDECVQGFERLRSRAVRFKILFLYCTQKRLEDRQTVGFHRLMARCGTLRAAIFKECEMLVQLFCRLAEDTHLASSLAFIDTSDLSLVELRRAIEKHMMPTSVSAPTPSDLTFATRGWNRMGMTLHEMARVLRRFRTPSSQTASIRPFNMLLLGETGVGKELLAQYLAGGRGHLVCLNCVGYTRELLESELWGHVKGAFTGAEKDRAGLVSTAQGKTLFVDEIGLADPVVQQKLLRFIDTREYKRLGEDKPADRIDCHLVAATSRNLSEDSARGTFLPDLFFRIANPTITIPSLRHRREDIPLLITRFLGSSLERLSSEALAILFDHSWPGNVRDLETVIAQCKQVSGRIQAADLGMGLTQAYDGLHEYHDALNVRQREASSTGHTDGFETRLKKAILNNQGKKHIEAVYHKALLDILSEHGGNINQTAKLTRVSRSTLHRIKARAASITGDRPKHSS